MKKLFSQLILLFLLLSVTTLSVAAHPGKLDGRQGHKDKDNVSGLGSYHYHCGDSIPHLHQDGICPILSIGAFDTSSALKKSKATATAITKKTADISEKEALLVGDRESKNVARIDKMLNRFYTNQSYAIDFSGDISGSPINVVATLDVDFLEKGSLIFYTYDLENNKIEKTNITSVKYSPKTGNLYFSLPKNTGFVIVSAGELQGK